MRKFMLLTSVFLSACQTNYPKDIDIDFGGLSFHEPGTIVHQSSVKLGNDFYDVSQGIVNSPDHWEGVLYTSATYYRDTEICQCSSVSTVISPDGRYIVYFSHKRDQLELFSTKSKNISVLSQKYIGYPKSADWNLKGKSVVVNLNNPNGDYPGEITARLD